MPRKTPGPLRKSIRRLFGRWLSHEKTTAPVRGPVIPDSAAWDAPSPSGAGAARVAVFLDMENVPADFIEPVADLGDTFGRVCHLAVYADWRQPSNRAAWGTTLDLGGVPKQIMKAGGANSADISIVVDAMEVLLLAPDIDVFVLASGDSDFVPLIQTLRARGKLVVGAAPTERAVRPEYESAFDRFEHLREPGDDGAAAARARVAPPATGSPTRARAPSVPSLETTRRALVGVLSREGSTTAGELGQLLRDAVPGFDQRALGFRRLSDLLRAQSDLIAVRTDGAALHVSLVGKTPPRTPPPVHDRGVWTRLRDYLLAVLLTPDGRFARASDAELRAAMDTVIPAGGEGFLPAVSVADIVAHYPSCFARADDGTVVPTVGLVDAYRLRLARVWEPVPREVMRRGLALLPGVLREGPRLLSEVASHLAESANGDLTQAQARALLHLVRKADGLELAAGDEAGGPRVLAKDWVSNPAAAEARLDEAARLRMGPFLPVDPEAMMAALAAQG